MNRRQFLRRSAALALGYHFIPELGSRALNLFAAKVGLSAGQLKNLVQRLEGGVVLPNSPSYARARQSRINKRIDIFPAVIALCGSTADVLHCVDWAVTEKVDLKIRSGGHCFEGFSLGPGLVIDLENLNKIEVNPVKQTAVIEAGTRLGRVYDELGKHGLALPLGSCPWVGMGGLTTGGGYGMTSRTFGLTCDHLASVAMVTASRELKSYPDLLWASQGGGGGSFGVVTSFTFKDLKPVDDVCTYAVQWKEKDSVQAFLAWQAWAPFVDAALTSAFTIGANGSCSSGGNFFGSSDQLAQILKPLSGIGGRQPTISRKKFLEALAPDRDVKAPSPSCFKAKSDFAKKPLDKSSVTQWFRELKQIPKGGSGSILIDSYGGAINSIPSDATAFCHREGTLFHAQSVFEWSRREDSDRMLLWIRKFYDAMRPSFSGEAYVNYCDLDLADWGRAYFGGNLERLRQIKKKYDPQNIFSHAQSIPPAET